MTKVVEDAEVSPRVNTNLRYVRSDPNLRMVKKMTNLRDGDTTLRTIGFGSQHLGNPKGVWISAQLLPVLEKRPVKVGPNREKWRFLRFLRN